MQIARVRRPNRVNLVVYVPHSCGIISQDADRNKGPRRRSRVLVFATSNYGTASDLKLNFHQPLPYERVLIKAANSVEYCSRAQAGCTLHSYPKPVLHHNRGLVGFDGEFGGVGIGGIRFVIRIFASFPLVGVSRRCSWKWLS